jgi:hypothetical protein
VPNTLIYLSLSLSLSLSLHPIWRQTVSDHPNPTNQTSIIYLSSNIINGMNDIGLDHGLDDIGLIDMKINIPSNTTIFCLVWFDNRTGSHSL